MTRLPQYLPQSLRRKGKAKWRWLVTGEVARKGTDDIHHRSRQSYPWQVVYAFHGHVITSQQSGQYIRRWVMGPRATMTGEQLTGYIAAHRDWDWNADTMSL